MRVILLGTGAAAPDPERGGSAILISLGEHHYLFDCGPGATRQLVKAQVSPAEVGTVFLSHLHFDHIADFPYFLLTGWILDRARAPIVVGPPETQAFVDHLFADGAFAKDIEARAQYPRRRGNVGVLTPDVRDCAPGLVFEDDRVKVTACYVEHIPREVSPCFGLRLETKDGKSVAFSGDTAPCERFVELARGVDLMIHECTFPESAIAFRKKAQVGTWAHTSPTELGELATRAEAKSLVATHFGSFDTTNPLLRRVQAIHMPEDIIGPHMMDEVAADIRKGYGGDLRLADDLMRVDL